MRANFNVRPDLFEQIESVAGVLENVFARQFFFTGSEHEGARSSARHDLVEAAGLQQPHRNVEQV